MSETVFTPERNSGRIPRRRLLINSGKLVGGLLVASALPKPVEAAEPRIINIPHEASLGRDSFPWPAIAPGRRAEVLEVVRLYGLVDEAWYKSLGNLNASINSRIRAQGRHPSIEDLFNATFDANYTGEPDADGMCAPAGAASRFAPLGTMQENLRIAGQLFTPRQRKMFASLQFSGLKKKETFGKITPDMLPKIQAWVNAQEALVVNWSRNPNQEWYGYVRGIDGRTLIATRYLNPGESGMQTEYKDISEIVNGMVYVNEVDPAEGSARPFFNDKLINFIVGTQTIPKQ